MIDHSALILPTVEYSWQVEFCAVFMKFIWKTNQYVEVGLINVPLSLCRYDCMDMLAWNICV